MSKLLATSFVAALLLVFATAAAGGSVRLEGTVAAKFPENQLVRVDSRRTAFVLRVPGSQSRIRVGQRVELRGTTLRRRGNGSRVLARNVTIAGSALRDPSRAPGVDPRLDDDTDDPTDDTTGDTTDDRDDTTDDTDDDQDNSGPGNGGDDSDDDDHGNRGPGGGDDD